MQLQVQRPVDPGDPDQGEDDGELGHPTDRDVLGQVVGRLADDGHIDQVIEQLQVADLPVGDDLAVGRGGRQNHRLKRLGVSLVMASVDHLAVRGSAQARAREGRHRAAPLEVAGASWVLVR